MSTVPKSIRQLVEEARAERDAGMALAETGTQADWDRKLIDQAIDAFADSGRRFSSNDIRPLLPEVRTTLIGSRFMAASVGGRIRRVDYVTSTKANTHAKPVAVWVGTNPKPAARRSEDDQPGLFDDIAIRPRRGRVVIFLGYVLLILAAICFAGLLERVLYPPTHEDQER